MNVLFFNKNIFIAKNLKYGNSENQSKTLIYLNFIIDIVQT
jgi:hypothetical protein